MAGSRQCGPEMGHKFETDDKRLLSNVCLVRRNGKGTLGALWGCVVYPYILPGPSWRGPTAGWSACCRGEAQHGCGAAAWGQGSGAQARLWPGSSTGSEPQGRSSGSPPAQARWGPCRQAWPLACPALTCHPRVLSATLCISTSVLVQEAGFVDRPSPFLEGIMINKKAVVSKVETASALPLTSSASLTSCLISWASAAFFVKWEWSPQFHQAFEKIECRQVFGWIIFSCMDRPRFPFIRW